MYSYLHWYVSYVLLEPPYNPRHAIDDGEHYDEPRGRRSIVLAQYTISIGRTWHKSHGSEAGTGRRSRGEVINSIYTKSIYTFIITYFCYTIV
jgi:hypothetical protein